MFIINVIQYILWHLFHNKIVDGWEDSRHGLNFCEALSWRCIQIFEPWRLNLWAGSHCCHQELHLVDKVASLHFAPLDLFAGSPEVAPLGVLNDVVFWQLFALAAGELDQNSAAALWTVPHWTHRHTILLKLISWCNPAARVAFLIVIAFIYFLRKCVKCGNNWLITGL